MREPEPIKSRGVEIPYGKLSPEALQGIAEEFVSREGTDYGPREYTFDAKVKTVIQQIKTGKAKILFDAQTQSLNLIAAN